MTDVELLVEPAHPRGSCGTGVLVLAGSSGVLERERATLLAGHGATALAFRWFGGPGQQPGPFDVPVELFSEALDRLRATGVERIAVLGTSFGAEAALLLACDDARVDAVVALSPPSTVWAGVADDGRVTSHWTRAGVPVPFVPFDEEWVPDTDPPSYRELYRRSLLAHPDAASAAALPVERSGAELLLVAGEDDGVWPAADFVRELAARRDPAGPSTTVVVHTGAGHRVVLPGESPVERGARMARGGTPSADGELGALAWPHVVRLLRLHVGRS